MAEKIDFQEIQAVFGEKARLNVPLASYTAARVGGPAGVLLEAGSRSDLVEMASILWRWNLPFVILGGASNVLISDAGLPGVVILNRARRVRFNENGEPPTVWAESGANFGAVARRAAGYGLAGLEWAAGIPGTLGGAVIGNAGAHDGEIAGNLLVAEILHHTGQMQGSGISKANYSIDLWPAERLEFSYRSSILKRLSLAERSNASEPVRPIVLSARLGLRRSTPLAVQHKTDEFTAYRRRTQPPGASMGSMFKNPPGEYAGRLIEAVGLKGARIGDAEISSLHANFFINRGQASATDIFSLINQARLKVAEKFGIELELEIELLGDFPGLNMEA